MHWKSLHNLIDYFLSKLPLTCSARSMASKFLNKSECLLKTSNIRMTHSLHKNEHYEVYEIDDFMSAEQCDAIVRKAVEKGVRDSTVVDDRGMQVLDRYIRKSQQTWLEKSDDEAVAVVSDLVAKITGFPESHQEELQVVAYKESDYYRYHFDASFHPDVIPNMNCGCGPRIYTILIYLNDDFAGGETDFDVAGIRVTPKKGKAIVFQNIDERLDLIPESCHAGLPVKRGTKWVANKWVRVWPMAMHWISKEVDFNNKPKQVKSKHSLDRFFSGVRMGLEWLEFMWAHENDLASKLEIVRWLFWHNVMIYNSLRMPVKFHRRDTIIVMDAILSEEICERLVSGDPEIQSETDEALTRALLDTIPMPVDAPGDHVTHLRVRSDSCSVLSPYCESSSSGRCSLARDTSFGLPMASMYIFLTDDHSPGGSFIFPYQNEVVKPKIGRAIFCFHLNDAMTYDCMTFCCKRPVSPGRSAWIAEKHMRVVPSKYVSIMQRSMEWTKSVNETLHKY